MRQLIAIWGILGVVALCGQALVGYAHAIETINSGEMNTFHWVLMVVWAIFNTYAEGYRGPTYLFPRTVSRAFYLADNPTPVRVIRAPLFCMGLFAATREYSSYLGVFSLWSSSW